MFIVIIDICQWNELQTFDVLIFDRPLYTTESRQTIHSKFYIKNIGYRIF